MIPMTALTVRIIGIKRTANCLIDNFKADYSPQTNNLKNAMRLFKIQQKAVDKSLWRGNCLSRSLVLHWLLHKHQINSEFHIGVSTTPTFKAHAWVTFQQRPLNVSRQALADYQLVTDYKLLERSKFE